MREGKLGLLDTPQEKLWLRIYGMYPFRLVSMKCNNLNSPCYTFFQDISKPGELGFEDELKSVSDEAKRLNSQGVKILIALGHAGYDVDMKIATAPYIDVVVGGHTNTFLYSGINYYYFNITLPEDAKLTTRLLPFTKETNCRT